MRARLEGQLSLVSTEPALTTIGSLHPQLSDTLVEVRRLQSHLERTAPLDFEARNALNAVSRSAFDLNEAMLRFQSYVETARSVLNKRT